MKVLVEDVRPVAGGRMLVVLSVRAAAERRERYRLSLADYQQAGAPEAGDVLDAETYLSICGEEGEKKAYERAIRILSAGDNSRRSLLRKLVERGFLPVHAKAAIDRLVEQGYLKEQDMLDRQFALFAPRLWGPGKYLPSLLQKGFDREEIAKAEERASENGIYDKERVKQALIAHYQPKDRAELTALLYRYGFR